jgi:hypothetical protein
LWIYAERKNSLQTLQQIRTFKKVYETSNQNFAARLTVRSTIIKLNPSLSNQGLPSSSFPYGISSCQLFPLSIIFFFFVEKTSKLIFFFQKTETGSFTRLCPKFYWKLSIHMDSMSRHHYKFVKKCQYWQFRLIRSLR